MATKKKSGAKQKSPASGAKRSESRGASEAGRSQDIDRPTSNVNEEDMGRRESGGDVERDRSDRLQSDEQGVEGPSRGYDRDYDR
ncbi:MAG: hypothetical protein NDI61_06885 [Bdellovibrionaceae bacterium]|nr:hypothetical protein [Pseudobdellovibrionaceae bacterium]